VKPVSFDYCQPETVAEAAGLLAELREDAAVLAGGMTLGPMLNLRMVRPKAVIDVSRLQELSGIEIRGDSIITRAMTVQADAMVSDTVSRELPLLALALPWVGHFQTRNRGTLGGSAAHADPSAEVPLCLVVGDATVVLRSKRAERRVRARDFFVGALATARQPDELLIALEWRRGSARMGHAFEEIAQSHGDFAIAAAACSVELDGDKIATLAVGVGGVENRPVAIDVSEFIGRASNDDLAASIGERAAASVDPMEDHSASAQYRRALTRVLVERVVARATADAKRKAGRQ
jgi:2-furoyl-CoA dehydrogenase FAD binding subunit